MALVTEAFWQQGDLVALSNGMPDVPRLRLPHPVAGTGASAMAMLAAELAPRLVSVLRGETPADNPQADSPAADNLPPDSPAHISRPDQSARADEVS